MARDCSFAPLLLRDFAAPLVTQRQPNLRTESSYDLICIASVSVRAHDVRRGRTNPVDVRI